jgi:hypothetical protein
MARTLVGMVFRTDKVESGRFVLYKVRAGPLVGEPPLDCPFIIRHLIEKLNAEDVGCIVEGLAMLPDELLRKCFRNA